MSLPIVMVILVLLTVASTPRSIFSLRAVLALLGLVAVAAALSRGHAVGLGIAGVALLIVNLARLLFAIRWGNGARLSTEESAMATRCFPSLRRHTVRLLLDEGLWVQAQPGEVIVREGTPVSHLFYLSEGDVAISWGGREIATSGPGHFFGEITVLSGGPATATVTLTTAARLWCAPAAGLRRFLALYPAHRASLEAAFAGDLRAKLQLANARLVAMTVATPQA